MNRFNRDVAPIEDVVKADFEAYEEVRKSGEFNMITHASDAAAECGLSMSLYRSILKNYETLMAKWPDVRNA